MARPRPQLEPDDLRQLKWLLGGLLSLISLSSLLYLEINAWLLLVVGAVVVPLGLLRPGWPARVPLLVHRLAFPAVVLYVAYDFYATNEVLASLVRVDVLLLLYRSIHYRRRREDLQLIVLGLFLVVMAGVITVAMAFALQIVAFVCCALLLMFVVTLVDAQEGPKANEPLKLNEVPSWTHRRWRDLFARVRRTCDWRAFALGAGLFAGFVAISGVLFMSIPRFDFNNGLSLDRLLPKKSTTGFSDVLKFGEVNDIQEDNSVVLRAEVSDRALVPQSLYWRMVVLDEYRDGTFRMSTGLKATAFARERVLTKIDGVDAPPRGESGFWTMYLEPVAGRYLPLTGGFRSLHFTEPQGVRHAPQLRLVMFGRDPVAMKAYRVEGMNISENIAGGTHLQDARADRQSMALSDEDRAVLANTVGTITNGTKLGPEAFARAAMLWLAKQHGYSLKSTLPAGTNDPLVRWLVSAEAGHCELFAGAFALLARTAGHPTRVVCGYMGGTWNDDYLMVRNSNAHAWCEIYLGHGQWLRVDPTNDGPRLLNGFQPGTGANLVHGGGGSWEDRIDRLRMLWYRHIVNFDQAEQQQMAEKIKVALERLGRQAREFAVAFAAILKDWLQQPWSLVRWSRALGLVLVGGFVFFVGLRWLRTGWRRWRFVRGKTIDPVRREAGAWLQKLDRTGAGSAAEVHAHLQRLRYGRRETWPAPKPVFRAAREVCRRRPR